MKGQKVGYVRVSSVEQNTGRQLEGIEVDRIFVDRASGKNTDRPKFQEMLNYVREGDRVIVHSMYRDWETDRKSTRLNSSHSGESRMPSSA